MNIDLFLQLEPYITNGMSTFQMEKFVVNDSITTYRKLRQALLEVKSRVEVLASSEFDLQESNLRVQKLRQEANGLEGIDQQLKEIEIKRLEYNVNRSSTLRRQQSTEVTFFMGIVAKLIEDLGGVDKVKELLSDPQYLYEQETEYWTRRMARSVFSDLVNYGTISKGVVESVSCLPVEQQNEIVQLALGQQIDLSRIVDSTRDHLLVSKD